MPIRHALPADLPEIDAVYNAAIPGRMATADTAPVMVASCEPLFREFDQARRPLWVVIDASILAKKGWLSLPSFYGRLACHASLEVSVYFAPDTQREHAKRDLATLGRRIP